ncbi:MAG: V4R domain-containing protein [Candidatus Helarchaeota archaeon]
MGLLEETKNFTFKDFSIFKGEIKGFNFRIIILHIEHFKQLYRTANNMLKDGIRSVYIKTGIDIGKKFMDLVITKKKADKLTAFKFILRSLERGGWGATLGNIKIDEDKKTVYIEIQNSPEAYEEGMASCFGIQGILRGMAEHLFETELEIVETECIAKGDKMCKFLVGPKEEVPIYDEETMKALEKIMATTKTKAGAIATLLATTEGRILFSNFPDEIDSKMGALISSMIALAGRSAGEVFNIGKTFSTIDGERGKLILTPIQIPNKKSGLLIIAQIGPNSSTQLAGLALKSGANEILQLFK